MTFQDLDRLGGMLAAADEEERLRGLAGLARLGSDSALPLVCQALGDPSWRVRKEAVAAFLALPRAADMAPAIIRLLHAEDNPGLRNAAVDILARIGGPAVPLLLAEISCADPDVRKFVLDILGDIGDEAALAAMIEALGDPDRNVRNAAVENLGKLGSPRAVSPLLAAMDRQEDQWFRFNVIEALGRIGTPVSAAPLARFRSDPLLGRALLDCLGQVGGEDALPLLLEGLADPRRNLREGAVLALAEISRRSPGAVAEALGALAGAAGLAPLVECFEAADPLVVKAAVSLSGLAPDRRLAAGMLRLIHDDRLREEVTQALLAQGPVLASLAGLWAAADPLTRTFLAYLWGETRCPDVQAQLREGLAAATPELRQVSALAIGKLEETSAMASLVGLLGDPVEEVREAAAVAFGQLGRNHGPAVVDLLAPLLRADGAELRRLACQILGGVDHPGVEECLAQGMKDESPAVRRAAVKAMTDRCGEMQRGGLMLALADEDAEVRRMAVETLATAGDPEVVVPLGLALHDEEMWVRTAAVRALGRFGGDEVYTVIRQALNDPVGLVVLAALETLAAIDPVHSHPHLLQALDHSDEEVVSAALNLLRAGGRRDWLTPLRDRLLNHRHWEVRLNFVRLLAETEGERCRPCLEDRLLVEGEDLVREEIRSLLGQLQE